MDSRLMELVQRAFDDECTPAERAELESALQRDPELREFQMRLEQLGEQLHSIPEEEAPEGLRNEILASLRENDTRELRHAPRGPFPNRLRDFAYFVAGAAAMFLIGLGLLRLPPSGRDSAQSVGSLMPLEADASRAIEIDGETLGQLRWTESGGQTLVELHWPANTPARLELELGPKAPTHLRVRTKGRESSISLAESTDSGP